MIFVHEIHDVAGGRMEEFGDAVRTHWQPLLEADGHARLLWFWELTHGTGASYQAVSITAVRDWATWGALVARDAEPRTRDWQQRAWALRREVTAKILLPTAWSPLRDVDLAGPPPARTSESPGLYLHDTGWPFTGKLEEYLDALGRVFPPQTTHARMISVVGCWRVARHGAPPRGGAPPAHRGLGQVPPPARPGRAGRAAERLDGGGAPLPRPLGIEAAALRGVVAVGGEG